MLRRWRRRGRLGWELCWWEGRWTFWAGGCRGLCVMVGGGGVEVIRFTDRCV